MKIQFHQARKRLYSYTQKWETQIGIAHLASFNVKWRFVSYKGVGSKNFWWLVQLECFSTECPKTKMKESFQPNTTKKEKQKQKNKSNTNFFFFYQTVVDHEPIKIAFPCISILALRASLVFRNRLTPLYRDFS